MVEFSNLFEIILSASNLAMNLIHKPFLVHTKEDNSPVTDIDLKINAFLIENLRKFYPNIHILSEETSDDKSRLNFSELFIIDPIDGTTELVNPELEFAINLAYVTDHNINIAFVAVPAYKVIYYAIKGKGAFKYYIDTKTQKQIYVSNRIKKDLHLAQSRSHTLEIEKKLAIDPLFSVIKPIGSSFKLCLLAEGIIDIVFKLSASTKEWDIAPCDLIVKEAGGTFTDSKGLPFTYNREDYRNLAGYLATNNRENELWMLNKISSILKNK